jgi:hypothetical protein
MSHDGAAVAEAGLARLGRRLAAMLGLALVGALLSTGAARADLYWGDHLSGFESGIESKIGHARVDGSEANVNFLNIGAEDPLRLAADDRYLYGTFPGKSGGSIGRVRLDGTEANPDFIVGPGPGPLDGVGGIAVSSQYVYWTNWFDKDEAAEGAIGRARIDGTHVEEDYIPLGEEVPGDLALSGSHLYFVDDKGIGRANVNGEEVDPEFVTGTEDEPLGYIWGLAASSEYLYWTREEFGKVDPGDGIGRASIDGGEVEPDFMTNLKGTEDAIAVDAQHIYWTNADEGTISRASTDGGAVEEDFISGAGEPESIALDHRIVVNSTAEYKDAAPGDGICASEEKTGAVCTLRAAIEEVNAEKYTTPVPVSVEIPGGKLEKVTLKEALPKLESPISLDARSQHGALIAGKRKIGLIVNGAGISGEGHNGLELGPGAAGSTIAGLQVEGFSGDGVLLEGEHDQLADSVLNSDLVGAEVAASNDVVGSGEGIPGDIFFQDGRQKLIEYLKGLAKRHESGEQFQLGMEAFGGGVLLQKASTGTKITGDDIGVHGEGFSAPPDELEKDGLKGFDEKNFWFSMGVLVVPKEPISNVTIGGTGEAANVIGGQLWGVLAAAEDGAPINGLSIMGNSFGTNADDSPLEPFGGLFGVYAQGSIKGLRIGEAGDGNTFKDDLISAALDGTKLESPAVQGNAFGVPLALANPKDDLKGHDGLGVLLSDVEGATIGGTGQGNTMPGALIGIALTGTHLNHDTISHNTIGTAPATPFKTFQSLPTEYDSVIGLFSKGLVAGAGKSAGQAMRIEANTIQGTIIGMETENVKGLQVFANTIENDAIGMLDSGSGGEEVDNNNFFYDGLGLFEAAEDPSETQDKQASVNPEDTKPSTREESLSLPDSEYAYEAVDAESTAELGPQSANTSAEAGSENSFLGNRFGVNGSGGAQPDELPVLIGGYEQGLRFGGTGAGEGNVVEDNRSGGLLIAGPGAHPPTVQVLGNTIYNNENFTSAIPIPGLGINLISEEGIGAGALGVDPQDPEQPAGGANHSQNAPVLASAGAEQGTITVTGSLHGVANTNYVLELFADEQANPFGAGEGEQLLGRLNLATDASGNVNFSASGLSDPGAAFHYVSSTATTVPGGGEPGVTSEFSLDAPIARAATPTSGPAPAPGPSGSAAKGAATTTVSTSGGSASTGTGTVTLPVKASCSSATATPCTVTILASIPAAAASSASVTALLAGKARPITIGHASLHLASGASSALKLTLTRRGLVLLKARHKLSVTVTVTISGSGRRTVSRTLHLKLLYKKPKKR